MDTKTNVARGLYLLARPLDVGESFTLDRGANSLTFDTMTRNRALTGRVRGLSADPMFFASRVLPDGTKIQHGHVAAFARWLEPDMRLFVTRESGEPGLVLCRLGLVLCRVASGARAEAELAEFDRVSLADRYQEVGRILEALKLFCSSAHRDASARDRKRDAR